MSQREEVVVEVKEGNLVLKEEGEGNKEKEEKVAVVLAVAEGTTAADAAVAEKANEENIEYSLGLSSLVTVTHPPHGARIVESQYREYDITAVEETIMAKAMGSSADSLVDMGTVHTLLGLNRVIIDECSLSSVRNSIESNQHNFLHFHSVHECNKRDILYQHGLLLPEGEEADDDDMPPLENVADDTEMENISVNKYVLKYINKKDE